MAKRVATSRDRGVRRLEVSRVTGGAVTYPPGATFGPRVLADFEVVWIVEGEVVYGEPQSPFLGGRFFSRR